MKKYWTTLKIGLHDRLVYRGNVLVTTCMRFLSLVVAVFLWDAIFKGSGHTHIRGYTADSIVAYYVLVMVARSFSSMPGLASGFAREVRQGEINKYIVRPMDLQLYFLALRVANKLGYYLIAFLPFALLIFCMRGYFPRAPGGGQLVVSLVGLVNGFLIGFLFHFLIGLLSLLFLEVSSFLFIVMVMEFFLNGHMFPVDLLPDGVWHAFQFLPFVYECFYPVKMLLGDVSGVQAWGIVLRQLIWILILAGICRVVMAAGLRRYSAYGG